MARLDLPTPYDPTPLYQEYMKQRLALLSQPTPAQIIAPAVAQAVSNVANQGIQGYQQAKQQQGVMQAQKMVADYLSLPDELKALPQNKQKFNLAAISLGITPPDLQKQKERVLLSPEASKAIADNLKVQLPASGRFYEDEIPGIKASVAPKPKGGTALQGDLTAPEMAALNRATTRKNNPLPVSLISFRGPRTKIMAQALMADPNWSPNTAEAGLTGAREEARTAQSPSIQLPARKIAAIMPRLDAALDASNKLPRSQIQLLNKVGIAAAAKTGNRQAQDLLNKAKLVADEFQSTIGSGSDSKLDLAMDLLNTAQTVDQFKDAITNMKQAMQARREAILTGKVPESGSQPSSDSKSLVDQYGLP